MNKEQQLKRLAMNIVNQLFDLADVPVEKRQAVNDEADAFVLRLLQQCNVSGSLPLVSREELISSLEDKRICKMSDLPADIYYLSRKETADYLMDNYLITKRQ